VFGYVARRLIGVCLMLVALSFVTFALFTVAPADPARLTCGKSCTPQIVEANRVRLGLNQPFLVQYTRYMVGIPCGDSFPPVGGTFTCLRFNPELQGLDGAIYCPPEPVALGYSVRKSECVTPLILDAFPITASLAIGGVILWMILGLAVGILAALRRGRWQDRSAMGFALVGYSFPTFFIALLLLYFLALTPMPWSGQPLMAVPQWTPLTEDPVGWFTNLILPWVAIAILSAAFYARLTRNQMLETLGEDYIRTARSKGLPERVVIYKHGLRAGLTPIVTAVGIDFAFLLGGAIIIEQVFALPGLGKLALDSTLQFDLSIVLATVLLAGFFVILANLIVDILYAVIDPRVTLV
jgi:peptide/nickel transport system permease protein